MSALLAAHHHRGGRPNRIINARPLGRALADAVQHGGERGGSAHHDLMSGLKRNHVGRTQVPDAAVLCGRREHPVGRQLDIGTRQSRRRGSRKPVRSQQAHGFGYKPVKHNARQVGIEVAAEHRPGQEPGKSDARVHSQPQADGDSLPAKHRVEQRAFPGCNEAPTSTRCSTMRARRAPTSGMRRPASEWPTRTTRSNPLLSTASRIAPTWSSKPGRSGPTPLRPGKSTATAGTSRYGMRWSQQRLVC